MKILFLLGLSDRFDGVATRRRREDIGLDAFVKSVIEGNNAWGQYRNRLKSLELQGLDINKQLHTDLPDGIAYGGIAVKTIGVPYDTVKTFLLNHDGGYQLVTHVKTMRNFEKLPAGDGEIRMRLNIKVPVVADIRTQVVSTACTRMKKADGYGMETGG